MLTLLFNRSKLIMRSICDYVYYTLSVGRGNQILHVIALISRITNIQKYRNLLVCTLLLIYINMLGYIYSEFNLISNKTYKNLFHGEI